MRYSEFSPFAQFPKDVYLTRLLKRLPESPSVVDSQVGASPIGLKWALDTWKHVREGRRYRDIVAGTFEDREE